MRIQSDRPSLAKSIAQVADDCFNSVVGAAGVEAGNGGIPGELEQPGP
jgi:hypothetical protein